MKFYLRFVIVLLSVCCFISSCHMVNRELEQQREKGLSEIRESVNLFLKGAQNADSELASSIWLDSPDFSYHTGSTEYNYIEFSEMIRSSYKDLLSQIIDDKHDKYRFLDDSTVIYTLDGKWVSNFKNGMIVVSDPWFIQFIFRKKPGGWKVLNCVETSNEKIINKGY